MSLLVYHVSGVPESLLSGAIFIFFIDCRTRTHLLCTFLQSSCLRCVVESPGCGLRDSRDSLWARGIGKVGSAGAKQDEGKKTRAARASTIFGPGSTRIPGSRGGGGHGPLQEYGRVTRATHQISVSPDGGVI